MKNGLGRNKIILVVGGVLALYCFVIILISLLLNPNNPNTNDETSNNSGGEEISYYTDSVSGVEVRETISEPEAGEPIYYLGFDILLNYGYSYDQYDVIMDRVKSFVEKRYPGANHVSFKKGSFYYDEEDNRLAYCDFVVIDQGEHTYTLELDLTDLDYDLVVTILGSG